MARSGTSVTISSFRSEVSLGMTVFLPRPRGRSRLPVAWGWRSEASDRVYTPPGERPVIATQDSGPRGSMAALWRRRRTLAGWLLAYVTLVVVGTSLHVAHHGMKPGQAASCPVLSAAEQLPWTPAEPPQVLTRIVGSIPVAPEPAPVSLPARPPRHQRDRAPPDPVLALAV